MKYFVHTGFDVELGEFFLLMLFLSSSIYCLYILGAIHYHNLLLPDPVTSRIVRHTESHVNDSSPIYVSLSKGAAEGQVVEGETYTHGNVLQAKVFDFAKDIIGGKYIEVDN